MYIWRWHMPTLILQKFWILRWVLYVTHAQPQSSKFEAWACCIFYTCKTLVIQLSELGGMFFVLHMPSLDPPNFGAWACHAFTYAQTKSSKFWSLGGGVCNSLLKQHVDKLPVLCTILNTRIHSEWGKIRREYSNLTSQCTVYKISATVVQNPRDNFNWGKSARNNFRPVSVPIWSLTGKNPTHLILMEISNFPTLFMKFRVNP